MNDEELRQLVEDYQPNEESIKQAANVKLLATVGPSATGKTTLMNALAAKDPKFQLVVGETTRQPRENEQNGVDMIFRNREEVLEELEAGKLLQIVIGPNGDLYCTRAKNFPTSGTGLFPLIPLGVRQFRALPLKFFAAAFIVPANFELWQKWLGKQAESSGWTAEQLRGRLEEAKQSFDFALADPQIRFVLNDGSPQAINRLQQAANKQVPADEAEARDVARSNYGMLLKILNK